MLLTATACGRPAQSPPPQRPAAPDYPLSCSATPDEDAHAHCLRAEGEAFRVNPALLPSIAPVGKALFALRSDSGFFWARADGLARPTMTFDNWADYYCQGRTRTLRGQKVGFMDKDLAIVVAAIYDFATPYRGGRAAVCNACREQKDGEHTAISCAKCGIVDSQGHLLKPLEQDSAAVFSQLPEGDDDECGEP